MDYYTVEEFSKFIAVAKQEATRVEKECNSIVEWHYYIFFMIAFFDGSRKGEINGYTWNEWFNHTLSIKRAVYQKNKGEDIIGSPDEFVLTF